MDIDYIEKQIKNLENLSEEQQADFIQLFKTEIEKLKTSNPGEYLRLIKSVNSDIREALEA